MEKYGWLTRLSLVLLTSELAWSNTLLVFWLEVPVIQALEKCSRPGFCLRTFSKPNSRSIAKPRATFILTVDIATQPCQRLVLTLELPLPLLKCADRDLPFCFLRARTSRGLDRFNSAHSAGHFVREALEMGGTLTVLGGSLADGRPL